MNRVGGVSILCSYDIYVVKHVLDVIEWKGFPYWAHDMYSCHKNLKCPAT